jgi:DNA repair exonuclease SbcCD nuclease subunit
LVVAGDCHKAQSIKPNILIPGSASQHDWGESQERKYLWIIEIEGGKISIDKMETSSSRFVTMDVNSKKDLVTLLDKPSKHFVKVYFKNHEVYMVHVKELTEMGVVCIPDWGITTLESEEEDRLDSKKDPLKIIEDYVDGMNIEDSQTKARKKLGLEIIRSVFKDADS